MIFDWYKWEMLSECKFEKFQFEQDYKQAKYSKFRLVFFNFISNINQV